MEVSPRARNNSRPAGGQLQESSHGMRVACNQGTWPGFDCAYGPNLKQSAQTTYLFSTLSQRNAWMRYDGSNISQSSEGHRRDSTPRPPRLPTPNCRSPRHRSSPVRRTLRVTRPCVKYRARHRRQIHRGPVPHRLIDHSIHQMWSSPLLRLSVQPGPTRRG